MKERVSEVENVVVVSKRTHQGIEGYVDVYIGRPSVFGNPFVVGKHGVQGECADLYVEYMQKEYAKGGEYRKSVDLLVDAVKRGKKIALVCWCKPRKCHGDHLKAFVDELVKGGK